MKNIVWIVTILILGTGLIYVLYTYFTDQNIIEAQKGKVDCLIKSASIDEIKFDKGNCYHIIQFKSPKI